MHEKCRRPDINGLQLTWQLKKSKSWGPFWSYQLHSTAYLANLARPNFEVNGLDLQCCLACSSRTAPMIFIFSIVLGAKYSSHVKANETHAGAILTLNILSIGNVQRGLLVVWRFCNVWSVTRKATLGSFFCLIHYFMTHTSSDWSLSSSFSRYIMGWNPFLN